MSLTVGLLTSGFVVDFIAYYVLVWSIRGERLGSQPSVFQLLSNPLFVRQSDLTERGRQLHKRLLLTLGLIVVLGLSAFFAQTHGHALP